MAKRRKRRTRTEILAARTITDIKKKKVDFLREVGRILSEALGFDVKVTLSKPGGPRPGRETTASRKPKAEVSRDLRRQLDEAYAPFGAEEPTGD